MNNDAITKTEKIFDLKCPWDNEYQGRALRVLFVCSAGLLRSPTGAAWGIKTQGWNTRSCGSEEYALIPLSPDLIMWAKRIVFVNPANFDSAMARFKGTFVEVYVAWEGYKTFDLSELIKSKAVVLDIPDNYDYGDAYLYKCYDAVADKIVEGVHGLIPADAFPDDVRDEYTDQWIGAEVGQGVAKK